MMRNAGPPHLTDNWKETGGGCLSVPPQKFRAFGSPVGRPLHTSAHSAGIPQTMNTHETTSRITCISWEGQTTPHPLPRRDRDPWLTRSAGLSHS
jgi:hypothetical protein